MPTHWRQGRVDNSDVCWPEFHFSYFSPSKLIPNLEVNTRHIANSKTINILQSKNSHQSYIAQESNHFCKLRRLLWENIYWKKTVLEMCINSSSSQGLQNSKFQDRLHWSQLVSPQSSKGEKIHLSYQVLQFSQYGIPNVSQRFSFQLFTINSLPATC